MLESIKSFFGFPTPERMRRTQAEEAVKMVLHLEAAGEHSLALAAMYRERAKRLGYTVPGVPPAALAAKQDHRIPAAFGGTTI